MSEFSELTPKESVTGLLKDPFMVFGNGVEIEITVYAKTTQESVHTTKDWRQIFVLPQRTDKNFSGTDVVKIHFLPKTSIAERANDPAFVPEGEKG